MTEAPLAAFIAASRRAGLDLSPDEWRDVCYVAMHAQGRPSADRPLAQARADDESVEWVEKRPPTPSDLRPLAKPTAQPQTFPVRPVEAGLHASLRYQAEPGIERDQLAMRAPTVPALSRLEFGKAFSALKRTVEARDDLELDVPATVRQAADTDLWTPVLTPSSERWLDAAVVVDDAASGPAWSQEIHAFLQALEDSGAFRGIGVWHFDSDVPFDSPLTVRGGTADSVAGRDIRELVDPSGRRAVLVLSDCVGNAWGDGRVGCMIDLWVATSPVAVLHLLPQRLWGRCRPRLVSVEWHASRPFTVGSGPQCRPRSEPATRLGSVVPVFDLTGAAMARWAALVSGTSAGWLPGTALCTADRTPEPTVTQGADGNEDDDLTGMPPGERSRLRVARFRAVASPPAFKLATLLSTTPLQPPVIRMVQQVGLGTEQATYWAEVLLSGLVDRVVDSPLGDGQHSEPYDFVEGVRQELLTHLTRREALDLLYEISDFMNQRLGGTLDFLTLLGVEEIGPLTAADRPFARVAVEVLQALGGSFAEKAGQLSELLLTESKREAAKSDHEVQGSRNIKDDTFSGRGGGMPKGGNLVTSPKVIDSPRIGRREGSRTTIWDAPPRISFFTGREELLDSLRQELVENPNQAAVLVPRGLFGLGGVGKTALANEYAHRYGGEYDVVWWIPAEDPADVRRSLVQLSRELRLPEFTDQAQTIRRLLAALREGHPKSRWLLVFDNATEPAELDGLMPATTMHGHVLITSRDPNWRTHGAMLQVDAFTRDESTALLRRRAKQITPEEADRLAELLQDLPLALNQAAAWHDETRLPTSEYLRQYEEKRALLPEAGLLPEYPQAVGATFGVSFEHLRGQSRAAAQLLSLCSHFGPEAISVDMLWRGRYAPDLPEPLHTRMLDRTWLKRELKAISRYELIQLDQARDRFQLHRLVQRILRGTTIAGDLETRPAHAQAILAQANPGNPDEVELQDRAKHAELSPHILPSNIIEATDSEPRKVVLDQIRFRYLIGDYEGARDLARLAIAEWERRFGPDDVQLLLSQRHLASTLRASGEPTEALQLGEYVLAQFRRLLGSDHEHTLNTASGYASSLRTMGRFAEALETDRENLERYRETLRDDDPDTLRSANNFAVDLRLIGDFKSARKMDEENGARWADTLGPEHPDVLFSITNLVRDLYGLGLYGEALALHEETLAAQEAAVGPAHPNVLLARRTSAMLLRKLGRHRQARERAEETYAAYVARFPEDHEHTLAAMMSLANALRDENRDAHSMRQARDMGERALALYESSFPGHPFVHVCQTNLAVILRASGEVAEARRLNTLAEGKLREVLGERHPYTLCAATNLASDLAASSEYAKACRLSERVLQISREESVRGPDHPYTLGCALNYSLDLDSVGRTEEAATLWRETSSRFVAVLGPDHPDSLQARERRRIEADVEPPPT